MGSGIIKVKINRLKPQHVVILLGSKVDIWLQMTEVHDSV